MVAADDPGPRRPDGDMPAAVSTVEEGLAAIAAGLAEDEMANARVLADDIVPLMPDLGAEGEHQIMLSCQANIRIVVQLLRRPSVAGGGPATGDDVPTPPPPPSETLRYMDMLVHRSLDVESLLDGYRVGHAALWRSCARIAFERVDDPTLLRPVLEATSEIVFRFINAALRRLREEYRSSRLAHLRWPTARKIAVIHDLLHLRTDPDPAELSMVLGYEVSRRNVGFVVRVEDDPSGSEAATAAVLAERIAALSPGSGRPLVLPTGGNSAWMWIAVTNPIDGPITPDYQLAISRLGEKVGATVGIGEPGDGLTGFRETHEQAQEALDTALRIGRPLARYGSVALISVLSSHPERARRMMRWYLGPLAGDTPANDRLRETLRILLDTHLNQREAARRMGVHAHTVGYRLQRIEELLGRPVTERAIELHAALAIYDTLPSST
jgi:hypothetical protein